MKIGCTVRLDIGSAPAGWGKQNQVPCNFRIIPTKNWGFPQNFSSWVYIKPKKMRIFNYTTKKYNSLKLIRKIEAS